MEESIKKFLEFYDYFVQNKTQLQSDVFEHFQKMRFQIDEQRESLSQSLETELNLIQELFRNSNLLIQTIRRNATNARRVFE